MGAAARPCRSTRLEQRVGEAGESYASLHVQTDDADAVEARRRQVPAAARRLGAARVDGPRNGWVAVYDELLDRDRRRCERLASELSNATARSSARSASRTGVVVRYVLLERGSVVDEYQSVPEHYGPLPPGDVVALGANPTVVARLTGAEPAQRPRRRPHAPPRRTSCRPPTSSSQQIAEVLGLEGAGRG